VPPTELDARTLFELPLFAGLSAAELAGIEPNLATEDYATGTYVFRRGDHGDALYVVLAGQVALENPVGSRPEILALCGPGDWFGELALLSGGPRTAHARVTIGSRLLRVSRAVWAELSLRAPELFARLSTRLSDQLRATNEPARRARHAVVACASPEARAMEWPGELAESIRRQFPEREVHLLAQRDRTELERALAGIVSPDALVLLARETDAAFADRRLEWRGPCEWRLAPGHGARPWEVIRGTSPALALDRVARRLAGGSVGIALGAGGAYGFAHLGMLRAFAAAGIPIDCVAGTSMGAIVGSAIAAGAPVSHLVAFAEAAATRYRTLVLRDLNLRGPSLLKGTGVMRLLAELDELREGSFERLILPFVAIAMDLRTGEEVVLDSGPLLEGIAPSFAMPGILPNRVIGERVMVDGAMVNPVPVDRARELGVDFIIAAQPIPPLQPPAADEVGGLLGGARWVANLLPLGRLRHLMDGLDSSLRSFQSLWFRLANASALGAEAIVRPDLRQFWFLQFGEARRIIEAGEQAAEAALPDLRRALDERLGWRAP